MASKKSRSVRKAASLKSQRIQAPMRAAKSGFKKASDAVTGAADSVPSSAIYWGLGALALGAAAVGAYIYRDRIVDLYETAVESFETDESGDEAEESTSTSARKSKSFGNTTQPEQH